MEEIYYNSAVRSLEVEHETLLKSEEMYNKTLEEIVLRGDEKTVEKVREELENICRRKKAVEDAMETLDKEENVKRENMEVTKAFIDTFNNEKNQDKVGIPIRKRVKKLKEEIIEANPVKINKFLVHFPEKFNIKPYMIEGYAEFVDSSLSVIVREFEEMNPILPIVLESMVNEGNFKITVDILNSSNNVYYTTEYIGCSLIKDDVAKPYCAYNSSEIRTYSLLFRFQDVKYITPSLENETTD